MVSSGHEHLHTVGTIPLADEQVIEVNVSQRQGDEPVVVLDLMHNAGGLTFTTTQQAHALVRLLLDADDIRQGFDPSKLSVREDNFEG